MEGNNELTFHISTNRDLHIKRNAYSYQSSPISCRGLKKKVTQISYLEKHERHKQFKERLIMNRNSKGLSSKIKMKNLKNNKENLNIESNSHCYEPGANKACKEKENIITKNLKKVIHQRAYETKDRKGEDLKKEDSVFFGSLNIQKLFNESDISLDSLRREAIAREERIKVIFY